MKTINEWLDEGRALLAAQQAEQLAAAEADERNRQQNWQALRAQLVEDLGGLAAGLPAEAPDGLGQPQHTWEVRLRPFGGAWIDCQYRTGHFDDQRKAWTWKLDSFNAGHSGYQRLGNYRVPSVYRCEVDPDLAATGPTADWADVVFTDSLAVAVAICHAAQDSYAWALEETKQRQLTPAGDPCPF